VSGNSLLIRYHLSDKIKEYGTGHVEPIREGRNIYRALILKPKESDHLENLGVFGRKILKWA
jgi:hypothetical protein